MLGTDPKTGNLKTRKTFPVGEHREIAIDRARYYAVTGDLLENVPDTLRVVGVDDVRWFIEQAGPAYLRLHGVGGGEQRRARDESGSGYGFRFMAVRKAAGDSYDTARNAILTDRGRAGEWGRRVDERQLERAWDNASGRAASGAAQLDVVCVADVEMKRVDWVWSLHLARGKVTIISGDPDVGKSHLGIDAIARVTHGDATWPDGNEPAPSGSAVILSAEDAVNDTIHPRLLAAYADVRRVHVIRAVCDDNQTRRTFNLQRDLDQLEQLIAKIGDVVLVIIDPISSYLGDGIEGNAITSVRPVLEAVGTMAERSNVAVLPPRTRSAVTNGKRLFVEGKQNTKWARRYRDLVAGHISDLQGGDGMSEAQLSLIKRASTIELELEQMEGKLSKGLQIDLDLFTRSAGHLRRILETLGLERRPKQIDEASLADAEYERALQRLEAEDPQETE
jgi:hypothetical protein